jgi:methionine-S-sulfoxide reductase
MVLSGTWAANQEHHQQQQQQQQQHQLCPLLPPPVDPSMTFEAAMGWFWGPQRDFDGVEGIQETMVGYSGSHSSQTSHPTYRNIQDYAESIRVTFDPSQISYQDLLEMFFGFHTPTDPRWAGTQYRSAIFVHTPEQRKLAEAAIQARGTIGRYVAVEDASDFYRAEEYHQKYIEKATSGM